MAGDEGDFDNLRQVPLDRAYGQNGRGEYIRNPKYNKIYNDFMMKPDGQCTEKEIRIKFDMAADAGDVHNQRQVPIHKVFRGTYQRK